jgi:citrate synthase
MHRLKLLRGHIHSSVTSGESSDSLTVTDNRTGQTYEFPIKNNTIDAGDLEKLRGPDGEVTRYYDPGYKNTVNCVRSQI